MHKSVNSSETTGPHSESSPEQHYQRQVEGSQQLLDNQSDCCQVLETISGNSRLEPQEHCTTSPASECGDQTVVFVAGDKTLPPETNSEDLSSLKVQERSSDHVSEPPLDDASFRSQDKEDLLQVRMQAQASSKTATAEQIHDGAPSQTKDLDAGTIAGTSSSVQPEELVCVHVQGGASYTDNVDDGQSNARSPAGHDIQSPAVRSVRSPAVDPLMHAATGTVNRSGRPHVR